LRHPVQFALYGSGQGGQPFVVHHERLDVGKFERVVLGGDLGRI
jgi:hypothetical protein